MAVLKPLLIEFGIHYRLESCARIFVPLKPSLGMALVSRTLLQSTSLMRNVPDLDPVDELLLLGGEEPPSDQGRLDLDLLDGQLDVDVLDDDLGFGRGFGRGGPPAGDVRTYHLNHMIEEIIITHFNRDKIESNLSVPRIQGCHENALFKSFKTSPHLICL